MVTKNEFQVTLSTLMNEHNMSQADLCRLTQIQTSLMSNYINGKKSPALSNAKLIAEALDVSLDQLCGRVEPIAPAKKEAPTELDESCTKEERNLIKAYRAASEDDRTAVNCILRKYREGGKFDAEFSEHIC